MRSQADENKAAHEDAALHRAPVLYSVISTHSSTHTATLGLMVCVNKQMCVRCTALEWDLTEERRACVAKRVSHYEPHL